MSSIHAAVSNITLLTEQLVHVMELFHVAINFYRQWFSVSLNYPRLICIHMTQKDNKFLKYFKKVNLHEFTIYHEMVP